MYSERKEFDKTEFTKDLNKKRFTYHIFLSFTIFFMFLAFVVYIYGKDNDVEFIYKICFPILCVISGIMSVLAIKAETNYNKARFCHCQKSDNQVRIL